jgi:alkylation response protein AidB-like acyl-CoA dehydrogenase
MAKLFASESAQEIAVEALRLHADDGCLAAVNVERYYRDTPLMIIGEGTNEIQRTIIARNLVERYGERIGALTSLADEPVERRQMVLAVRQLVDKQVIPAAAELDAAHRHPADLLTALAELGILGTLAGSEWGGLGLDERTAALIIEEIARGSAVLAALVTGHFAAVHAVAQAGTAEQHDRLLPPMTRGEIVGAVAFGEGVTAVATGTDWILDGGLPLVDHGTRAGSILIPAATTGGTAWFLVRPAAAGARVGPALPTLGLRGLDPCALQLERCRVSGRDLLGGDVGRGEAQRTAMLAMARLGVAATAVGLSQAAFEAALRYAQQRTTFGKPIAQHQAVQLALADMATAVTAARLLTADAAAEPGDAIRGAMAKVYASETAYSVTLASMRVHGGYGYTSEFPVERYYRDAARLASSPVPNTVERRQLARTLALAPGTAGSRDTRG